jgi:hypothetical protein
MAYPTRPGAVLADDTTSKPDACHFEVQHAARGSGPRSARRPALSCGVKQLHVAVPSRYRQAVRRPPAHCRAARGGRENPAVPTKPCSGRPQPAEVRNRRRSSRGAPSPDSQSQRRGAGCPPRLSGQSVARMGDSTDVDFDTLSRSVRSPRWISATPSGRRGRTCVEQCGRGCLLASQCPEVVVRPAR